MNTVRLGMVLAAFMGFILQSTDKAFDKPGDDIEKAYNELVSADHWRKAKTASEKLGAFGDAALPVILKGTKHKTAMIREYCYKILRSKFPRHPKAIQAIIDGLNDKEQMISYPCAFHLGENGIVKARRALKACIKDKSKDNRTLYAAAKSLAELGEKDVMVRLYTGLGSDDHYTRYLANIGIKALCGRDLSDFGYEGPWEGAFVSGPRVIRKKGQPIEKAKKRLRRCQAIVAFLEWIEKEKPKLFKELDNLW